MSNERRDPHPDEPFLLPTPEANLRLRRFIAASKAAKSPDFMGCVLMSLLIYVEDDEIWTEAIDDALKTCSGGA